jgi:hypothetical protein
MTEQAHSIEALLREALAPVEPPAHLIERVEETLTSITELAADELEGWELSAMRDPRNWARPATALVVGGAAGGALLVLRARRRAKAPPTGPFGITRPSLDAARAERALRDLSAQTRRLFERR